MTIFTIYAVILTIVYIVYNIILIFQDLRRTPKKADSYIEEYAVDPTDDLNSTSVVEQTEEGLIIGGVVQPFGGHSPQVSDSDATGGVSPSLTIRNTETKKTYAEKQAMHQENSEEIDPYKTWSNKFKGQMLEQHILDPQPLANGVEIGIIPIYKSDKRI